jgi:hypothetical protein
MEVVYLELNAQVESLMVVKVTGKCVAVLRVFDACRALPVLIILMITVILVMVELIVLVFVNAMSTALLWTVSLLTIANISIQSLMRMVVKAAVEI